MSFPGNTQKQEGYPAANPQPEYGPPPSNEYGPPSTGSEGPY